MKKLDSINWEFKEDDTRYLTHSIHRYSSKFIPQIAATLIENLSKKNDVVLDCFCGSGTTLVEANLLKRKSYGIDLNPIACLISKVKITYIPEKLLKSEITQFLSSTKKDLENKSKFKKIQINQKDKIRKELTRWYFPENFRDLKIIKNNIEKIENKEISDLMTVSFSEIVRRCSKAASSYPNLMIDKEKKPISSIIKIFENQMNANVKNVIEFSKDFDSKYKPEIIEGDSRKMANFENEIFDLVICHPPYVAAVPYAEFLRLSLMWLGYDPKYYDSVLIGGKRSRKDVYDKFMISMKDVIIEIKRVLKKGKTCALIIGNPQVHGEVIKLNETLTKLIEEVGMKKTYDIKRERINMRKGRIKDEFIITFTK